MHDGVNTNRKRRMLRDTKRLSKGYFKFNPGNSK